MKLATFRHNGSVRPTVCFKNLVVDMEWVLGKPLLKYMLSFLNAGNDILFKVIKVVENLENNPPQIDGRSVFYEKEVELLAPLSNPGKIICIGQNYKDHYREQSIEPPKAPIIFAKWPSRIIGPNEKILLPKESSMVDYEAKLAFVIGQKRTAYLKKACL